MIKWGKKQNRTPVKIYVPECPIDMTWYRCNINIVLSSIIKYPSWQIKKLDNRQIEQTIPSCLITKQKHKQNCGSSILRHLVLFCAFIDNYLGHGYFSLPIDRPDQSWNLLTSQIASDLLISQPLLNPKNPGRAWWPSFNTARFPRFPPPWTWAFAALRPSDGA